MYQAPLQEIDFVLRRLLEADSLSRYAVYREYSSELAASILEEAARFATGVLDPLNHSGDRSGAKLTASGVVMPEGFKPAYAQFAQGGWPQLSADAKHGGQGLPLVLTTAIQEIFAAANLAFMLCPMLTVAAVEALIRHGTAEQKARYLPPLVRGEWTGTMNLTEPQAGSDLGEVRMRAVPEGDHFRLFGQKIFISYGDHDLTPNIIHMVLARIEGAPAGVRGISMLLVPKVCVNDDASLGALNDVHCVSIEHKLGIHASPTCVLSYGEERGAVGYLVGEPNRGLEYMFVMMNAARLAVGLQGFAVAERAFQQARAWAHTRTQGKAPGASSAAGSGPAPIIVHPDVRRMLLQMKARTEAMRALTYYAALNLDRGAHEPEAAPRAAAQARGELLIPIVKGWCTESSVDVASLGVQVHGGMGYVEETGAAQYFRDVRITSIYEGTTSIQANDLVGRKIGRDRGAALRALIAEMRDSLAGADGSAASSPIAPAVLEAVNELDDAAKILLAMHQEHPASALAVSVPFLKLAGVVLGGWLLARSDAIARRKADGDARFLDAKQQTAAFYSAHVLPEALALARTVGKGAGPVLSMSESLI